MEVSRGGEISSSAERGGVKIMIGTAAILVMAIAGQSEPLSPSAIIQKSVEANNRDWQAAPDFRYRETDRTPEGSKTYDIRMIQGSPYQQLVAINGKPVSASVRQTEQQKLEQTIQARSHESASERKRRFAEYEKERQGDHAFLGELTKAFQFRLDGQQKLNGHNTYLLTASPLRSWHPPNIESEALTGMTGRLWVDTKTFQWVKVEARVLHPVAIAGFLAEVEPGTRFELENIPVDGKVWLPGHFVMASRSRILFFIPHHTAQNQTFSDYQRESG